MYPHKKKKKNESPAAPVQWRPMLSANEDGWNTPGVRMLSGEECLLMFNHVWFVDGFLNRI